MNYLDANTWIGAWPFTFCDSHTARSLQTHLKQHGIQRALVSPLGAVLAPAPGPANRELLRTTRGLVGLIPVPVINPALANWREELALVATDARVRAVRILPNYHGYRLRAPGVNELVAELTARGVRLIVQMRLIDHRHEYHAMKIKPVPAADLAALLDRHPRLAVLASGLLQPELRKWLPLYPQLLADLTFAEWYDTLNHLREKVAVRQLAFASHTPFLITAAARAKLDPSTRSKTERVALASGNLDRWLP